MDKSEWTGGFGTRFGMVYVDSNTLEWTPKLSAQWYRVAAATPHIRDEDAEGRYDPERCAITTRPCVDSDDAALPASGVQ